MVPALSDGSHRTRVRRLAGKQVHDRAALHAVLDAGKVAHVGLADDAGQPYVLPVAYARDGETVLVHGSTGSRLFRALADGAPTCLTVTLYDGLVAARSAFESSMHYRSAMVLGHAVPVPREDVDDALRVLTEHLMPGRWAEVRHPSAKERAATLVLRLPLTEWSVKVSDGDPDDDPADVDLPVWAGVVPVREVLGTPRPAPDLPAGTPLPDYVRSWADARA